MSEPSSAFQEQRKHLRLNACDVGQPTCLIPVEPGRSIALQLTDISPGGFGATIPGYLGKHFHKGCEFAHCAISLRGIEDVSVRVANLWLLRVEDGEPRMRAGFEFTCPVDWAGTGLEKLS